MKVMMRRSLLTTSRRCFSAAANVQPEQTQLFIGGKYQDAVNGQTMETINPATEQVITSVSQAGAADVDLAVAAARKAFDTGSWPRMPANQRGYVLNKVADLLERDTQMLANLETIDNGKPLKYSVHADLALSVMYFRYYAGLADKALGDTVAHQHPGHFGYTLKEPIGVVGQIIPWNFPLLMATWKLAPALAAGNCAVLKLSEKTPLTGLALGSILAEAGIPDGTVNILAGMGDTGEAMCRHPGIDKIAFTGSTATAQKIQQYIGETGIKPLTMELGGKSPALVFETADIDHSVATIHAGLFFNHGQCCCASSRVLVHESVYDEFLEKSVKMAADRPVGDPFTDVEQGPQVDDIQFNKVLGYIQDGKDAGVNVAVGGGRKGDVGYYIEPTIFTGAPDGSKINQEEIFGPVMCVDKFSTSDEAVARANDTTFGLAAGIFTNDLNTANRVSRGLRAGTIWVNSYNIFGPSLPFGGYKSSGTGRENGQDVMNNYYQTKTVSTSLGAGDQYWA